MNEVYINIKDIKNKNGYVFRSFKNRDLVSVQELLWTILDLEEETKYLEEELNKQEREKEQDYIQEQMAEYKAEMARESLIINQNR